MKGLWRLETSVVLAAALIAASVLIVGHYQISTVGYGYGGSDSALSSDVQAAYRLDRWTGTVEYCHVRADRAAHAIKVECPPQLKP